MSYSVVLRETCVLRMDYLCDTQEFPMSQYEHRIGLPGYWILSRLSLLFEKVPHICRDFRVVNQTARLMARTRVTGIIIFAVAFVIYYFVKMDACQAFTSSASGYLPLHVVMTAKVAVLLYLNSPTNDNPGHHHVLQVRCVQTQGA